MLENTPSATTMYSDTGEATKDECMRCTGSAYVTRVSAAPRAQYLPLQYTYSPAAHYVPQYPFLVLFSQCLLCLLRSKTTRTIEDNTNSHLRHSSEVLRRPEEVDKRN